MRVVIEAGRPKEPIAEEVAGTQREEGGVKGQRSKAQGDGGEKRLKSLRTPGREKEEGTEVEWPGRIREIQEGADLLGASQGVDSVYPPFLLVQTRWEAVDQHLWGWAYIR